MPFPSFFLYVPGPGVVAARFSRQCAREMNRMRSAPRSAVPNENADSLSMSPCRSGGSSDQTRFKLKDKVSLFNLYEVESFETGALSKSGVEGLKFACTAAPTSLVGSLGLVGVNGLVGRAGRILAAVIVVRVGLGVAARKLSTFTFKLKGMYALSGSGIESRALSSYREQPTKGVSRNNYNSILSSLHSARTLEMNGVFLCCTPKGYDGAFGYTTVRPTESIFSYVPAPGVPARSSRNFRWMDICRQQQPVSSH